MKFVGSNRRLPVASHLTDEQYVNLMQTYAMHNSSLPAELRVEFVAHNIKKVVVMPGGNLQVFYQGNEWFVYTPENNWN